MGQMFYCIFTGHELERLCTYHIGMIKFIGHGDCMLIVLNYGEFFIVYLPRMTLEDMVDCALTIYERCEFV